MAKGISLEEFKSKLDTDAQQRCLNQKRTIKELTARNKNLIELLAEKDKTITALQNRCIIQTGGIFCIFCRMKHNCKAAIEQRSEGVENESDK